MLTYLLPGKTLATCDMTFALSESLSNTVTIYVQNYPDSFNNILLDPYQIRNIECDDNTLHCTFTDSLISQGINAKLGYERVGWSNCKRVF